MLHQKTLHASRWLHSPIVSMEEANLNHKWKSFALKLKDVLFFGNISRLQQYGTTFTLKANIPRLPFCAALFQVSPQLANHWATVYRLYGILKAHYE